MTVSAVDTGSAYERIAADYPRWHVTHAGDPGQWVASHDDVTDLVVAATVERLLDRLEIAELKRLTKRWRREWVVWRSQGGSWMATARVDDVEPTLMCDSPVELEERMRNPGTWAQRAPGPRRPL
ncbi:hypothetical protein KGD82_13710 [Nocardiopsis eucommiae]|uniref:Uncharacterized protein n=1 Tax=Nocardiopsis eucommiae TaxID=2831970 RepID=A0A975LC41_9ACTN|nr:hypothetical protein KGD82_13710 [Nocardiopsis eucommiae]